MITVEQVLTKQISDASSEGISDGFQAGYGHALCWTWEAAGLPKTQDFILLQSMVAAFILADERNAPAENEDAA